MSGPFGSSQWMYSSGGFYPYAIDNSLRFNDDDSAYLTRTPSSAGNRKTWTWSGWVKRGNLGTLQGLFHCYDGAASRRSSIVFNTDNTIGVDQGGSSTSGLVDTVAVFRDTSAWYHIVVRADYSNGTASDRVKIYVNGVLQSVSTSDDFDNADGLINSTNAHELGSFDGSGQFLDGYMADVNFIDGTALDPTSFGETKSGIWIPKEYSGSYGTNGFYLSSADSSAIGDDLSGNTNDFTANNLAASDVVPDSPTNNFMTFNPLLRVSQGGSFPQTEQGNLRVYNAGFDQYKYIWSTFDIKPNTGKWYFEVLTETSMGGSNEICGMGLTTVGPNFTPTWSGGTNGPSYAKITWRGNTGVRNLYLNDVSASQTSILVANMAAGDIWQWAMDTDTGKLWVGLNNTWYDGSGGTTGNPSAGTNPTYTFGDNVNELCFQTEAQNYSLGSVYYGLNAGQDSSFYGNKTAQGNADANGIGDFYYTPPSGFLALCSANLPAPAIDPADDDTPEDYFNTVLYTGTGSTQSITGVGLEPDFVWIKQRSGTAFHNIYDRLRIVSGDHKRLYTNATNAEESSTYFGATNLSSFDSDGFSVGGGSDTNNSGSTYVAWNWKAGGTAVSNTDGDITSQVSANTKAGFSIASYTGNGLTNQSIGHGLNKAPELYFHKARSTTSNWGINTNAIDGSIDFLMLNLVDSAITGTVQQPTSTVVGISGSGTGLNASGQTYIAYCFHSVEGYSKVGSYTGNGSSDGSFIYTGFRPAWVMTKRTDSTSDWRIHNNNLNTGNMLYRQLEPNSTDAEFGVSTNSAGIDTLSNGFKLRGSSATTNASGGTYIFLAFAEQPAKYSNAR